MDNFRIISVSHVKGKLWNVVYQIENKNHAEVIVDLKNKKEDLQVMIQRIKFSLNLSDSWNKP